MKTILLVEDDEGVRGMVQDILEYAGYRVVSATNGRQGVASMSLFNIDLIVCDIMMPALDGRKMCHIIRAIPRFESVPILLMSAHNEQVRRQFAYAAFLSKPFTVNELLDAVSELLDRQSATA
ncbi:MAG TPA: response regulator [Herpetosiphonaceae bacterium]|nr:response regulator [Herpetosiphonaceae bacterium]